MDYSSRAFKKGKADGNWDAKRLAPRNPRPSPMRARLFGTYREEYIEGYNREFSHVQQRVERQLDSELRRRSHLARSARVPKHHHFERGWRDGYDGKDALPEDLDHFGIEAYERGHSRGSEHRRQMEEMARRNRNR